MPRLSLLACLLLLASVRARAQTPDNRPPVLSNPDTLAAAIAREYPPELLKRQIGGVVHVRLHVTAEGAVDSASVATATGDTALDAAAVRVARSMRFTPALRDGGPVALWAVMPIEFRVPTTVVTDLKRRGPVRRLELANAEAVKDAMRARYPEAAGAIGLLAHVSLRLAVDSEGQVQRVALDSTSCFEYFDEAALQLAGTMRFPARSAGDTASERLTALALTFSPDSPWIAFPGDSTHGRSRFTLPGKAQGGSRSDSSDHHTAVAPELINRDAVRALLLRSFPSDLREQRVGGDVFVDVLINEQGVPERRLVVRSSGVCALDMVALRVAAGMRFSPGQLDGKPRRVWIRLPVKFKS